MKENGSQQLNSKKVLIDLDSLLDTRLGKILYNNPDTAYLVSSNPAYYQRETEDFLGENNVLIGREMLSKVPKEPSDLLPLSQRTIIWGFVSALMLTLMDKNTDCPVFGSLGLEINFYPYVLSNNEIKEIEKVAGEIFQHLFGVKLVRYTPHMLNVTVVKDNYLNLIMYNPKQWLDTHQNELRKGALKDVVLYIPKVNQLRALTEEEQTKQKEFGMRIWEDGLKMLFAPCIQLEFLPVKLFCAETPINPPFSGL